MPKALPANPHIDWLKKAAKERLAELRAGDPAAKLHQAQLDIARDYGFESWRALKAHVDAASLDGQVIAAATGGEAKELARLLDAHPAKMTVTGGRWNMPLLHLAAEAGMLDCVELLLGDTVGVQDPVGEVDDAVGHPGDRVGQGEVSEHGAAGLSTVAREEDRGHLVDHLHDQVETRAQGLGALVERTRLTVGRLRPRGVGGSDVLQEGVLLRGRGRVEDLRGILDLIERKVGEGGHQRLTTKVWSACTPKPGTIACAENVVRANKAPLVRKIPSSVTCSPEWTFAGITPLQRMVREA